MFFNSILLSIGLVGSPVDTLETLVVTADKGGVVSSTDTVLINPTQEVGDVLRSFTSLHFSDNGGTAGLKTASFRGLGSAHTSVYIDGVKVSNLQSGQTDLGMLGIGSYSMVVADYAQNALYFSTALPDTSRKVSGELKYSTSAYASYHHSPSGRINVRLGENVFSSFSAGGTFSKGDYFYSDDEKRKNNDMRKGQFGTDFWGITNSGKWHAKAYLNTSDRGVAGSLSYPSTDRQEDNNAFAQFSIQNRFTSLYELHGAAKFAYDHIGYMSTWGDNYYDQYDAQTNTSHLFRICNWFSLSAAVDAEVSNLDSDNYQARRTSLNGVLSALFRAKRVKADLSADYLICLDKDGADRYVLSPSADLKVMIVNGLDFALMGRRSFRTPTFNELYYVGFGNPDLNPEDAWITDCGLELRKPVGNWTIKAFAHGFYNYLQDKITSAPSPEDPNVWAPYNIGKVQITGFDALAGFEYSGEKVSANASVKYTLTNALDKTEDSYTFDQQIPYIPKHAFLLKGGINVCGWGLEATYNLRMERKDAMGDLPDWNTLDITASKTFENKHTIFLTANNVTNRHYEIATGYPMPGINISGGFRLCF